MDEQDLFRIVRNLFLAVIDLVDSNGDEATLPAVLLNVKIGAKNLIRQLDDVVDDDEEQDDYKDEE
jgi:hypothetical protein